MWAGQRTLLLPGSEADREGLRKLTETQLKLARMWEEEKYYHCTSWAVKIASGDYSDPTVIQWGISSSSCTTCHWGPWAPEQLSLLSSRDAGVTHRREIPRQGTHSRRSWASAPPRAFGTQRNCQGLSITHGEPVFFSLFSPLYFKCNLEA